MEFEWDESKNERNLEKHGIDFHRIAREFKGPCLEWRSDRGLEPRWVRVLNIQGHLIAVVYTLRQGRIRIISARKARQNEQKAYRQVYG